jgi:hypothetical protein
VEIEYPPSSWEIDEDANARTTLVRVSTRRAPLTGFTLQTTSDNFSRRVVVETRSPDDEGERWRKIAEATLERVGLRGQQREALRVLFAAARHEQYRLVIENRDSPSLAIAGVTATGNVHRVAFVARPGRTYRAAYGAAKIQRPEYDIAAVLAGLPPVARPATSSLGIQHETANYRPRAEEESASGGALDNWYFLGAAIAAMALVLGWALFVAGRKLKESDPPP